MLRRLLSIVLVLSPTTVWGDGLAVLELRFHKVPPALSKQIRQQIQKTLGEDGYDVMPQQAVVRMLRGAGIPPGCTLGPCLNRVHETLKVKRVLYGGILSQGTSYDITLTLLETGGGSVLSQVNDRCNVCTFMEVQEKVAEAARQLHKQALVFLSTRCSLTVRSRPPGANVLIDDLKAGETPLTKVLSPGSHNVEVAAKGYASASQTIHLDAGRSRALNVTLVRGGLGEKSAITFENNGDRSSRPAWLMWTALGAGVVMTGLGGGLLALDGAETSDPRYVHDTSTAGITLLSLGGAALVTVGVIYLLDSSRSGRDVAQVRGGERR
jgi:hypothetical protein